jgi:hypothetical protein
MKIQMEANGGFRRVLGLLNNLVHDSKEQLHEMSKLWRGVQARCAVSKVRLSGRQEFFENYLRVAQNHLAHAQHRLGDIADHKAGYAKSAEVYGALLKQQIVRHQWVKSTLGKKVTHIKAGLAGVEAAMKSIKDWSPRAAALIQTHVKEIAANYLQVQEYQLPDISEFLDTERTTDGKVRQRLLQWMAVINRQLLAANLHYGGLFKHAHAHGKATMGALGGMVAALKKGLSHLVKARIFVQARIKHITGTIGLYSKLVGENKGLMKANKEYCTVEAKNFHGAQVQAKGAIKMFTEIRHYFVEHYQHIRSFIKTKFH